MQIMHEKAMFSEKFWTACKNLTVDKIQLCSGSVICFGSFLYWPSMFHHQSGREIQQSKRLFANMSLSIKNIVFLCEKLRTSPYDGVSALFEREGACLFNHGSNFQDM